MKTHPDSIHVSTVDVALCHKGFPALCCNEPESFQGPTIEFVPASVYLEMRNERDEAEREMAKARDAAQTAEMRRDTALFILFDEADERGGHFKRMYDEWKKATRELEDARATIAQLRTAETERPAVWKPTEGPDEWAWYREDFGRTFGGFTTEADAIADAVANEGEDHRTMVGQMRDVDPEELFDLDDLVDQAECQLNDMVEDGRVHPLDGAAEALADWARRYITVDPSRICEGRQVFPAEKEEE